MGTSSQPLSCEFIFLCLFSACRPCLNFVFLLSPVTRLHRKVCIDPGNILGSRCRSENAMKFTRGVLACWYFSHIFVSYFTGTLCGLSADRPSPHGSGGGGTLQLGRPQPLQAPRGRPHAPRRQAAVAHGTPGGPISPQWQGPMDSPRPIDFLRGAFLHEK